MTPNEYQEAAYFTANQDLGYKGKMFNWALGIAGEAGELLDVADQITLGGREFDATLLNKEQGDCYWYGAVMAKECELPLSEVLGGDDFDAFQLRAVKTEEDLTIKGVATNIGLLHVWCGRVASRGGKLVDYFKKVLCHVDSKGVGHPLDTNIVRVGLVEYFSALACVATHVNGMPSMATIAEANIAKLRKRYAGATFSKENSMNRAADDV